MSAGIYIINISIYGNITMKLSSKTSFNIGITLLCIAVLVMMFFVGRSAFIAGGRTACKNTNGMILVVDFKCEQRRKPMEFGEFIKLDIENGSI